MLKIDTVLFSSSGYHRITLNKTNTCTTQYKTEHNFDSARGVNQH